MRAALAPSVSSAVSPTSARLRAQLVAALLLVGWAISVDARLSFGAGLDAQWTFSEANDRCVLRQAVPDFGEVRFVRRAGQPLALLLDGERTLFEAGTLKLRARAPIWGSVRDESFQARAEIASVDTVALTDPAATNALMALHRGFDLEASAASWFDPDSEVEVRVSTVNFLPLYERFVRCFDELLPASWSEIERSRLHFETAKAALSRLSRSRLELVARYIQADPTVGQIFIDGHTDAEGGDLDNVALSKRRAQAVAQALIASGVPEQRIKVRFHGDRYPVADNASPAGRAENRRTTIRLEKSADAVAVR